MQMKIGKSSNRRMLALASAVAACGFAGQAYADPFTATATASGVAEKTSVFTSQFFDIGDIAAPFPGWGAVEFPSSSVAVPVGQQVNFVAPDLTVNMWYDSFSGSSEHNSVLPITLNFYLATDTTTSIAGGSPLRWEATSDNAGGLNNPGNVGSFAAGTSLYPLGSGIYPGTNSNPVAGSEVSFALPNAFSNSTVAAFVKSQINTGGDLRLVIASAGTGQGAPNDTGDAEFFGPTAGGTTIPNLGLDLTLGSTVSNSSSLYVGTAPQKSLSVTLGSIPTAGPAIYSILKNSSTAANTASVTLLNGGGGTSPTGNLTYKVQTTTAHATLAGPNDATGIVPSGNDVATFGFSTADTNVEAGSNITATANFINQNNSSDGPVTVTSNTVHVLEQRFLDAGGTSAPTSIPASDVGKVLVGATVSVPVPITTTNTDTFEGDESLNSLTQITLKGNQSVAAFQVFAPFSLSSPSNPQVAGNISASTPNFDQVFDNAEIGTVNAIVTPTVSGNFGNGATETIGTASAFNNANYADLVNAPTGPETVVVGSGLTGETDDARVYIQWEGYQAAAVTGNNSPVSVGGAVTLSNALSNDDIVTAGGATVNEGQRAGGVINGVTSNQTWTGGPGWGISGLPNGTTIVAGGSSVSAGNVSFTPTTQMISGTYGATLLIGIQNERDIQGTSAATDPAPVAITVQGGVVNVPGPQTGVYSLNGGTLAAPATILTGTYTQTGGASTFASIANSGTLDVSGGSITVSSLSITGAGKMVLADNLTAGTPLATSNVNLGSLAISGLGTLDIGNNHIIIDYSSTATDPIASIATWIHNGFYGLPGPAITSSDTATADSASGFSYGVGYADGADGVIAGLPSGEIEIMFTLLGDANLDGTVNTEDFTPLSTNLGQNGGWDKGDFNYDGSVNTEDFTPFSHDLSQTATFAAAAGSLEAADGISLASVPEPASVGLLAAGTLGLLARRRRQRS